MNWYTKSFCLSVLVVIFPGIMELSLLICILKFNCYWHFSTRHFLLFVNKLGRRCLYHHGELWISLWHLVIIGSQDNVVGIEAHYIWTYHSLNPCGDEIFHSCPDHPQGPASFLYNVHWVLPMRKWPQHGLDHPPPNLAPRCSLLPHRYLHDML